MKSKEAKIFLERWQTKLRGVPVNSHDDAMNAVEMAEKEMKQKAIESFKQSCPCWSRFQQDRKCDECTWLNEFCNQLDQETE